MIKGGSGRNVKSNYRTDSNGAVVFITLFLWPLACWLLATLDVSPLDDRGRVGTYLMYLYNVSLTSYYCLLMANLLQLQHDLTQSLKDSTS